MPFNQARTLDGRSQAHDQGVQLERHEEGGEGVGEQKAGKNLLRKFATSVPYFETNL